jgi:hypothetical protein
MTDWIETAQGGRLPVLESQVVLEIENGQGDV